jgi:hypothetical protein
MISQQFQKVSATQKARPKTPGKRFISGKLNLRTPEEAATFAVENIAQLTFEQITEIEKAVAKARPPLRVDGIIISEAPLTVLYGCRILQPLVKMKDVQKMADRWSDAWCGGSDGTRSGVRDHTPAWVEVCQKHWTPFVLDQLQRAVAARPGVTMEDAVKLFYPEI